MDMQVLKEKIESLDPKTHKALRDALIAELKNLTGEKREPKPQDEPAPDTFAEIFEKTVDELNRGYIEGTLVYIQKHHPKLNQKINDMEKRLDEIWKAGLQGTAGIEEFQEVLKQWYILHLRGIAIYSKEQGKQPDS